MDDGTPVYRLVTGRIYPLGIGFTTNPAADVEGVVIDDGSNNKIKEESEAINDSESIHVNSLDLLRINNNFSQTKKNTVNLNNNNIMDLEQILTELKTVLAEKRDTDTFSDEAVANVSQRIAESIKEKSDEIQAKISAAEESKLEAIAEADKLKTDLQQNSEKLEEALSKINELESTLTAQAAQELFNSRMGVLDADYDFEDVDRKILVDELKGLENSDEAFASFQEKISVLYRHKSKAFKEEQEKIFQEKLEAELAKRIQETEKTETSQASVKEEESVEVEAALANSEVEEASIPAQNIEPTEEHLSWKDKLGKAFSKENITIKF